MNVLYIHGFRSQGTNSPKVKILRQHLPPGSSVIAPDLTHDFATDLATLESIIQKDNIELIVGTSMGGLIANYLGNVHEINTMLVNPLVDIQHLAVEAGKQFTNYKTGKVFIFDPNALKYLTLMSDFRPVKSNHRIDVYLGEMDTVLDPGDAINKYQHISNCKIHYRLDDHRFNHFFGDAVEQVLSFCSN